MEPDTLVPSVGSSRCEKLVNFDSGLFFRCHDGSRVSRRGNPLNKSGRDEKNASETRVPSYAVRQVGRDVDQRHVFTRFSFDCTSKAV